MSNQIIPNPDYSLQIGLIVSEVSDVRNDTMNLVKNLSPEELDTVFGEFNNSIGTLLFHFSALELKFQCNYLFKRRITDEEYDTYKIGLPPLISDGLVHGNDLDFYMQELHTMRTKTLEALKTLNDDWLYENVYARDGRLLGNNHYFLKHYLMHDELCHQGQIKIMLKTIWKKKSEKV
ncbi:DinB family protein [Kordia sp.]|uniref:DinB family protein n=1 Tax=Kordia sp. TaxID=1965332 RepID=UPI003B5B57D5